MRRTTTLLLVLVCVAVTSSYNVNPGPWVKATKGEVWPIPYDRHTSQKYFIVRPSKFTFKAINQNCDILQDALNRYWGLLHADSVISHSAKYLKRKQQLSAVEDNNFSGYLQSLEVYLHNECEDFPHLEMDEEYYLNVTLDDDQPEALLSAKSIWGILRGLETFSQLIHKLDDRVTLIINETHIHDFPRFPHRGLLLDTSRHFFPIHIIEQILDAMSYNKLNVFHWHIVDDQSFPYQSPLFLILSQKGSYDPVDAIYTPADVRHILKYARLRGIRVLPEFDTPAHTRSWGVAFPELLTTCYDKDGTPDGFLGPMNPARNSTYDLIWELFEEVTKTFPDAFFHIGGDEADFDCWESNKEINTFMEQLNITGDYAGLEAYFVHKVLDIVKDFNRSVIIWEDLIGNGINVSEDTVVQVWKPGYNDMLNEVTSAGNRALLSSCWYLDHLATNGDWLKYYECEPLDFPGTEQQKQLVLGGEACMWGEFVNENNVISRVWPRGSAAAEILWSQYNASSVQWAQRRLEEHTCRMNRRGIAAQPPNGPGYCY